MPGKHGPNRLANYIAVHESYMANFLAEGFVVRDDCRFTVFSSVVILEGPIHCLSEIVLDVSKEIEVQRGSGRSAVVKTKTFRYHAWIRGKHNILRYESAHHHRVSAHKHVYDMFAGGRETQIVELQGDDDVPTLGEVLRELQVWHDNNAGRLSVLR